MLGFFSVFKIDAVFLMLLFLCTLRFFFFTCFHMNFRSNPRVICPDIVSGLFVESLSDQRATPNDRFFFSMLVQKSDAASKAEA